ncbi:MAG: tryptophan synthase subunit beta [Alphaproteobacteria bacterium RIFCSPLOWO2_01_FULL_40_26]|nr:MAG: tryptophan synthase subunit beta [Alphaproteobacteria bacterium RIFCSPHIGHO2_02_FULL_40_34]OFW94268.1 MAG: tryptophan synthase subunit beta [Alphaproteobacteria bacterium RIFCSPLOWO2_01_FULL_40_26]OFX09837.1 MAG: tryptophan synthase subunit beta [Alphaproteobacteria bacterium RIFCSPLOWO2_02_FULL_40_19]OFX11420.1 MAG: tryptophan synthase subunit beta [Alphaproteobacteria bacterium RIFCSPLOWO2_12_FULL_40_11]
MTYNQPNKDGKFGQFGGRYVAESLMPAVLEMGLAYAKAKKDKKFQQEFRYYLKHYVGRPSPLYLASQLTKKIGGAKIYLKRDELNHTGSHKINNCIGQILLAKRMNKKRIIAETGAGQHGVACATVCALFSMPCVIYMGKKDVERQKQNVFRMKLLGAEVRPVESGSSSLKNAINEAMRDWIANARDTYYLLGTVAGPHPYPQMVRDFHRVIGKEAKKQILAAEGKLPDALVACIGGGSNAIGLFHPFLDEKVKMYGVEAAGNGLASNSHAASIAQGEVAVLHGNKTFFLQNDDGQIQDAHSISAGLDYPGIGPEHAYLHAIKRVEYVSITDDEALKAFQLLCQIEGIIPALESSHAIAFACKLAKKMKKNQTIIVNLSGRGDKDIDTVAKILEPVLNLF